MQSDRLLALLLLLQAHGRLSAADLARRLEVSIRTIYRDLDALSAAGVPVYTERGPGGGCSLLPGYTTDMTGLSAGEAQALFVFAGRGLAANLGHEANLKSGLRKLLAALPEPHRPSALRASERVVVDPTGWAQADQPLPYLAIAQEAVWSDRRLDLGYRSSDAPAARSLTVEPYGLVAKAGIWYLIAAEDGQPRLYRVSRIEAATLLDETFRRPPGLDLQALWLDLRARFDERGGAGLQVRTRVRSEGLARFLRVSASATSEPPVVRDGHGPWTQVELRFRGEGPAVACLLSFGGEVEALEPASLRATMVTAAEAIAARYRATTKTCAEAFSKTGR